jgi:hypothetical protein
VGVPGSTSAERIAHLLSPEGFWLGSMLSTQGPPPTPSPTDVLYKTPEVRKLFKKKLLSLHPSRYCVS